MLETLIKELETDLDTKLPSTSPGKYTVPINDDIKAELFELPQGICLSCTFLEAPKFREEHLYERLLNANLFGLLTKGAVIGINEQQKLIITRMVDHSVMFKEFKENLEDFLNIAEYWNIEIINYVKQI